MYRAMEQMSSLFFSLGVVILHRIGGFAVAGMEVERGRALNKRRPQPLTRYGVVSS
jgi:hypothetical protein